MLEPVRKLLPAYSGHTTRRTRSPPVAEIAIVLRTTFIRPNDYLDYSHNESFIRIRLKIVVRTQLNNVRQKQVKVQ